MTIRNRTLLIVAATLAALVFVVLVLSQFILVDSYNRLEVQRVDQNLSRVANAIDALFANLRTINRDWSHWDSSYAFAQSRDEDFVEREMPNEILANIATDYVIALNARGEVIAERAIDRLKAVSVDFPPEVREALLVERFSRLSELNDTHEDVVFVKNKPLLVAASNILTSSRQGPSAGKLIFAQRLDDARIADMAAALDLDLQLLLPDLSNAPEGVQARAAQFASLSADNPRLIQPISAERSEGVLRVPDLAGQTAFYLRLVMPRDIVQQGQNTIAVFTAALVVSGFVLGGAILALLELNVLRPLSLLSEDVGRIGAEQVGERVTVRSDDEIGLLAQAVNRMLERLDESRRTIRESEERLRTVVDNAPVLIWTVNKAETITSVQGSSVKALGLDAAQIVNESASAVADRLGLDLATMRQALQGQEGTSAALIGQSQFVTRYQPLRDSRGEVTAVLGVATDVSKSRQSAEEIQDAYRSLEKKHRQLERVQMLIASTLGQIDNALQRTAPRDELRQYVRFARERLDELG
ncbi:MAG: HAMP domain-containing protein [Anaerolineae bacterium]|nr:HAMP domain-containing protein [Anaerolineae bacterium]MDW8171226.1 CHASE4 domain-containing protein [Anaerolineae bacterium]